MTILPLLLLSLIAGGLVNWIADTVPTSPAVDHSRQTEGQPPRSTAQTRCRQILQQPSVRFSPSTRRYGLVCLTAFGLGWLAQAQLGWTPQALLIALEAWFFLAIAVIDLEHHLVLNRMVGSALPLFFAANLFVGSATLHSLIFGGLVGSGIFLFIAVVVPGAMGMGDVKLAGLIGATVGLTNILIALYIAIMFGGIVAIVLLIRNRFQRNIRMAYAPYLVLGAWVVLFNGQTLLYTHLFRP